MHVAQALESAKLERGKLPASITVDNGSEFCSRTLEAWVMAHDVQLCFIRPGRRWKTDSSKVSMGDCETNV
jgi:putative transposase